MDWIVVWPHQIVKGHPLRHELNKSSWAAFINTPVKSKCNWPCPLIDISTSCYHHALHSQNAPPPPPPSKPYLIAPFAITSLTPLRHLSHPINAQLITIVSLCTRVVFPRPLSIRQSIWFPIRNPLVPQWIYCAVSCPAQWPPLTTTTTRKLLLLFGTLHSGAINEHLISLSDACNGCAVGKFIPHTTHANHFPLLCIWTACSQHVVRWWWSSSRRLPPPPVSQSIQLYPPVPPGHPQYTETVSTVACSSTAAKHFNVAKERMTEQASSGVFQVFKSNHSIILFLHLPESVC